MTTKHPLSNEQRIWHVVSRIPAGKVASYSQVAEMAGLPRAARLVGSSLKKLPSDTQLPWHRVISQQGKIAFPPDSPSFNQQKKKLQQEGIEVTGARVSMAHYRWNPLSPH